MYIPGNGLKCTHQPNVYITWEMGREREGDIETQIHTLPQISCSSSQNKFKGLYRTGLGTVRGSVLADSVYRENETWKSKFVPKYTHTHDQIVSMHAYIYT